MRIKGSRITAGVAGDTWRASYDGLTVDGLRRVVIESEFDPPPQGCPQFERYHIFNSFYFHLRCGVNDTVPEQSGFQDMGLIGSDRQ